MHKSRATGSSAAVTGASLPTVVSLPGPALTADGETAVVEFSADGTLLFAGGGPRDAALQIWDARSLAFVGSFAGASRTVATLALSPDGSKLASCDVSRTVLLYDVATRARVASLTGPEQHSESIYELAWTASGDALLALDADGRLLRWDLTRPASPNVIGTGVYATGGLAVSPDGRFIATSRAGGGVDLRDATTGRPGQKIGQGTVDEVLFSRDSQRVYLASAKSYAIAAYTLQGGRTVANFTGHSDKINALALTPDGKRLLSGSGDRTVRVWDATSGRAQAVLTVEDAPAFWSVAASREGALVAAAGNSHTSALWSLADFQPVDRGPPSGHRGRITSLHWSADGEWLASAGGDGRIYTRHARDGSIALRLADYDSPVHSVTFAPSSSTLIATSAHGAHTWDVITGKPAIQFPVGRGAAIGYSPDGRYMSIANASRVVELRRASTGSMVRNLGRDQGLRQNLMRPTAVTFSPDGTRLATARWDEKVHIYQVDTGRLLRKLDGFLNATWSPDGRVLATSYGRLNKRTREVSLRLWNTESWEVVNELDIDSAVQFTPDGRYLLGTDDDLKTLRVWRITDREPSAFVRIPGHVITSFAVSSDGSRVATGGNRGGLYISDLTGVTAM